MAWKPWDHALLTGAEMDGLAPGKVVHWLEDMDPGDPEVGPCPDIQLVSAEVVRVLPNGNVVVVWDNYDRRTGEWVEGEGERTIARTILRSAPPMTDEESAGYGDSQERG
jgi:hypothetical protein